MSVYASIHECVYLLVCLCVCGKGVCVWQVRVCVYASGSCVFQLQFTNYFAEQRPTKRHSYDIPCNIKLKE